jgi:hypothetical protein
MNMIGIHYLLCHKIYNSTTDSLIQPLHVFLYKVNQDQERTSKDQIYPHQFFN